VVVPSFLILVFNDDWSTSRSYGFTPGETAHGTPCIGSWVSPRESNPNSSVIHPVAKPVYRLSYQNFSDNCPQVKINHSHVQLSPKLSNIFDTTWNYHGAVFPVLRDARMYSLLCRKYEHNVQMLLWKYMLERVCIQWKSKRPASIWNLHRSWEMNVHRILVWKFCGKQ
jgi:hypothetical protein